MQNRKNILLAPNGKPSNLNEEQYYLVRTPQFKKWFGDWEKLAMAKVKDSAMDEVTLANLSKDVSKVVDENGEPLVVYHGTPYEFTIFKKDKPTIGAYGQGFYFTNDKGFASNYAKIEGSKILTCFLNVKKIFEIDNDELPIGYEKYSDMADNKGKSRDFTIKLKSLLYDGVFAKNTYNENEFVVFEPNQVKLADGTNTTFDGSNPDIRFDDGGEVKSNSFMKWYIDWYKGVSNKMNIVFSLPNAIQPFKEKNAVILDLFEKKDQTINAKPYLKKIVEKANEYDVVIYLEPKPRHKYFQDNSQKKNKITREYLIDYYEKFGFQLTPNKQFMKRLPHFADGGLIAPNGKKSNLTTEQYKLVRTPQFKKWFGDWENDPANASKIVDENGEPLVVFHGSSDDFNVFEIRDRKIGRRKTSTRGFYFTNNRWVASQYAGSDGFVKSYFIKILNYPTKKDKIVLKYDNIDDYLFDYGKTIEKFGYDGAVDNNGDFIVFESNQIKLADGSNTTFDGTNPDIRFDGGGEVNNEVLTDFVNQVEAYQSNHYGTYNRDNLVESYLKLPDSIKEKIKPITTKNLFRGSDGLSQKSAISFTKNEGYSKMFGVYSFPFKVVEENKGLIDTKRLSALLDKMRISHEIGDDEGEVIVIEPIFSQDINKNIEQFRFDDGGKLFNNRGNMKNIGYGGITYGESHANGGIKVQNKSTGEMLEVEGGEGVVNKRSMASDKMIKLNGKQMSICEAVSKLNEMEGGVKFSCDDVKHKQFIEEMEFGGELERGIRTEKEHIATLIDIYNRKYTPEQATEMIAKDHLEEDPYYYSKLATIENTSGYKPMVYLDKEEDEITQMIKEQQRKKFERELIMARGGMTSCGCSHHKKYDDGGKTDCGCSDYVKSLPRPKLENGAFIDFSGKDLPKFTGDVTNKPTSIGGLIDIKGQAEANKPNEREERNAERFKMVLSRAEELLNKDYLPVLKDSQQTKYLNKYFEPYNTLNLYKLGWRFTINTDAESVGLCEYNRAKEKNKQKRNLYLSYRYIIGDDNFINEMDSVILHEISHAIVAELFFLNEFELDTTQIREVDLKGVVAQVNKFDLIDPQHEVTKGHGVTWANVCIALTGGYICRMFYEYAIKNEQINPFMYKCIKCGTEDFGDSRSFAKVCKKCSTPVLIVKHFK